MATNLDLDPELIEQVLLHSGKPTKKAAVTQALQDYVTRKEQHKLKALLGNLHWDSAFDYLQQRRGQ